MILPCFDALRGIIFDLDGVLWDSTPIHEAAYRRVLNDYGLSADFVYAAYAGMRTDEALTIILKNAGFPQSQDKIEELTRKKQYFARTMLKEFPPFVMGVSNILLRLSERFQLALASSSSRETVELFLNASETKEYFRVVLSGTDVLCAKPAPDLYIMAKKRLELPAEQLVVIEDAVSGVQAATGASLKVIGIGKGKQAEFLLDAGAVCVIEHIEELVSLL